MRCICLHPKKKKDENGSILELLPSLGGPITQAKQFRLYTRFRFIDETIIFNSLHCTSYITPPQSGFFLMLQHEFHRCKSVCYLFLNWGLVCAALGTGISTVLEKELRNFYPSPSKCPMQRGPLVLVLGFRICAMLEKKPSDLHASRSRRPIQRGALVLVLGCGICVMFEQKLSKFHPSQF